MDKFNLREFLEEDNFDVNAFDKAYLQSSGVAAGSDLNYEEGWNALVTFIILEKGIEEAKKFVEKAEEAYQKWEERD